MKVESKNKTVVTKCEISLELESAEEILAIKNICSMAENNVFDLKMTNREFVKELELINKIREALVN